MKALQKFRLTAWPSFAADKGAAPLPVATPEGR